MEADWEFDIGPNTSVIDAHWEGLVDLVAHPEGAAHLPEAANFQQMAQTLVRLNGPQSSVRTSKCDVWQPAPDEFDSDELDAPSDTAQTAWACYIDLTACDLQLWKTPDQIRRDCTNLTISLRLVPLRCCRADLIIRRALLADEEEALGITAYLTACSSSQQAAKDILGLALHTFADSVSTIQTNRAF